MSWYVLSRTSCDSHRRNSQSDSTILFSLFQSNSRRQLLDLKPYAISRTRMYMLTLAISTSRGCDILSLRFIRGRSCDGTSRERALAIFEQSRVVKSPDSSMHQTCRVCMHLCCHIDGSLGRSCSKGADR